MAFKSEYLQGVYDKVCQRNKGEEEFLQAVKEVLESFEPVVEKRPDIVKAGIIDRLVEPERFIQFRVPWLTITVTFRSTEASEFSLTLQSVHTRAA